MRDEALAVSHPQQLSAAAQRIRLRIVSAAKRAGVGHIGSALSVADIVAVLYSGLIDADSADSQDRDRVVFSKGHAAMALYAGLVERGWMTDDDLATYCTDGSAIATHPECVIPGVDFSSGSLGQGLSVATGAALAARMTGSSRRVFALLSDAECDSGGTWEAALFAGHHALSALTAIVDVNGQQALGYTRDVLDLEPLADKWSSFRWDVIEADGHSVEALYAALSQPPGSCPRVVLARTISGRGVDFMEGLIKWHYFPMSDEEFAAAVVQIEEGLS
jgi:transketolase